MSVKKIERHILLINPWIYDFAAYDFWLKPLGLLTIAALLRENGFRVHFIDCLDRHHPGMLSLFKDKKQSARALYGHGQFFKERIQKPLQLASVPRYYKRYGVFPEVLFNELKAIPFHPDAVLITTLMTYWYLGTAKVIDFVKEIFPNTPVIAGGNYVTLCADHARALGADYYVTGEGEKEILSILKNLIGQPLSYIPDEGNLDFLPFPAFDLINHLEYVCIQTTRGCPFRCAYCASHLINKKFRRVSPDRVVKEIEYWHTAYKVRNMVFYDDALLFEPESHSIPILEHIIEKGLKGLFFHTPNGIHARFISPKIAALMCRAGFKTVRLGYETSDKQRQIRTGGKVTDSELGAAIAYLKEAGFEKSEIGVYIMIGLPGQGMEEIEAGIERIFALGGTPVITEFSPIPGTALWEEAVRSSKYDLPNEPLYHNNSILPCEWDGFLWKDYLTIKSKLSERKKRLI